MSEECGGGGAYYRNPKGEAAGKSPLHDEARDWVWEHTQEVIQSRVSDSFTEKK